MKVLFLSGVFAKENEAEVIAHAKGPVEYSANRFQEKIINGFREENYDITVLSAPFIGAFPIAGDIVHFKGFGETQDKYQYVNFCNVWGIRNLSRARALKRELDDFIKCEDSSKLIVVTSPHTPFVDAAAYAKKKDPRIQINLIIPDLPQYMNLKAKVSWIYKIGKKVDIAKFNKLIERVDAFTLLTEAMAAKLKIENKPYIVVEGILESDIFVINENKKMKQLREEKNKLIVYTGKTDEKFGIKELIDAFMQINEINYRLIICGRGDSDAFIKEKANGDTRIIMLGQVTPEEAQEWILKADVLVNPRLNNEEYTKFSFPSKNLEYLASGNSVVYYMLDGMKDIYSSFANIVIGERLDIAITQAADSKSTYEKYMQFKDYASKNLSARSVVRKIISLHAGEKNEFSSL